MIRAMIVDDEAPARSELDFLLKETGQVRSDISALASDLRGLSNLIKVSDLGIRVLRNDQP